MTRVTQLIHDAGKYLLISVYPLPTHPTHNFTHNNGGNLETLPGWPKKLQHNRPARVNKVVIIFTSCARWLCLCGLAGQPNPCNYERSWIHACIHPQVYQHQASCFKCMRGPRLPGLIKCILLCVHKLYIFNIHCTLCVFLDMLRSIFSTLSKMKLNHSLHTNVSWWIKTSMWCIFLIYAHISEPALNPWYQIWHYTDHMVYQSAKCTRDQVCCSFIAEFSDCATLVIAIRSFTCLPIIYGIGTAIRYP